MGIWVDFRILDGVVVKECGRNHQADLIDKVTVTLVYTEELATVASILSTDVTTLSDSVVRKVVVHGGPWKQDALPLVWELFFE